jgi:uncharacterized peroxidase-related enzyme
VVHHRRGLRRLLKDDELLARLDAGWRSAGLDPRRTALLIYAEKLTLTPAQVQREDIEALRAVGFADEDILAIAEVTAYYAYVNRIADGLGVQLEEWMREEEESSGEGQLS